MALWRAAGDLRLPVYRRIRRPLRAQLRMIERSAEPRRRGLVVASDQLLSSATNFGSAALAAGLLSTVAFGAYAMAVTVYLFALTVVRAWSGLTVLMYAPGELPSTKLSMTSSAFKLSVGLGAAVGALTIIAAAMFRGSELGPSLVVVGIAMPALLGHDALRLGLIATERPERAVISDLTWLIISFGLLMALRLTDTASGPLALAAWGAGSVAGIAVAGGIRSVWRAADVLSWVRQVRVAAVPLSLEAAIASVGGFVMLITLITARFGLDSGGSVRAAQVIMGPTVVACTAIMLHAQPLISRDVRRGRPVRHAVVRSTLLSIGLTIGWLVVALATPRALGTRVFGVSWDPATDVLTTLGWSFLGIAAYLAAGTVLRGFELTAEALAARMISSGLVLGTTVIGAVEGADGAIIGFTIGTLISPIVPWTIVWSRFNARRGREGRGS